MLLLDDEIRSPTARLGQDDENAHGGLPGEPAPRGRLSSRTVTGAGPPGALTGGSGESTGELRYGRPLHPSLSGDSL